VFVANVRWELHHEDLVEYATVNDTLTGAGEGAEPAIATTWDSTISVRCLTLNEDVHHAEIHRTQGREIELSLLPDSLYELRVSTLRKLYTFRFSQQCYVCNDD